MYTHTHTRNPIPAEPLWRGSGSCQNSEAGLDAMRYHRAGVQRGAGGKRLRGTELFIVDLGQLSQAYAQSHRWRERGRVPGLVMVPLSGRLERFITNWGCQLSGSGEQKKGRTTGSRVGRGREGGGWWKSGGRRRQTEGLWDRAGKVGLERKWMKEWKERRVEKWRQPAKPPDCMVYCMGKMVGSAGPPNLHSPTSTTASPNSAWAPATLYCFPREPDSTAGLIKPREAERQKKTENEREVTQLEDISWNRARSRLLFFFFFLRQFFPFISHFMIEFLTNRLAEHWVQTHSKKSIVWFDIPQNAVNQ